jgi:hypothetical protein
MTVIADFSLPTDQFVLGHTSATVPGIDIEIERMAANTDDGLTPYFHVSGGDLSGLDQALADDPTITEVTLLEDFETERFYRANWTESLDGFMPALQQADAAVQSATCQDGHWELRLLFGDRDHLSGFYEQYSQSVDLDLLRVFERSNPATYGEFGVTENQRNALVKALEMGYFEVPKQTSTEELADELGVSPQATSQRLRRGHQNLLMNTLGTHEMSD